MKKQAVLWAALAVVTLAWTAAGQVRTITLDRNYTGAPANTTRATDAQGCLMGDPLPVPTRAGQVFNGWFTVAAATGGNRVLVGATGTKFTADATIYARWTDATPPNMSNIPAAMKENFDWLKNTRHVREPVLFGRHNLIFDQIFRGNGTINWAVRWESTRNVSLAERQAVARMLHEEINKWTRPLIGMPNWPFQEIPVTVIGWAVANGNQIQDRQPNEQIWVNNTHNAPNGEMTPQMASAPNNISRFVNFNAVNNGTFTYTGGLHARFDMYLWATTGFGGGAGGDWGTRVSDSYVISASGNANGTGIITHEVGHGFGLYDFYGAVGTDRPPATTTPDATGNRNFGSGDLRTVMIAGGGAPSNVLNSYDQWQIRYYWDWVRNGANGATRFPVPTTSAVQTVTAQAKQPPQFRFDNRGTLTYNLNGAQAANLKIFDSRGRLVKTMQLSGTQTTVSTNLNVAPQMLIWRVEAKGRVMDQGKVQFAPR